MNKRAQLLDSFVPCTMSREGTIQNLVEQVIPSDLQYRRLQLGIDTKRNEIKIPAQQTQYVSTSNRIIRIRLPNEDILDFSRGYLEFTATLTTTAGTFRRFHTGIWSIFERVRVKGNREIEDIRQYNLINSIVFEVGTPGDVASTIGPAVMGVSDVAARNLFSAGRTYGMPLNIGFLSSGPIPVFALGEIIELEFYIGDPTTYVETDGTSPVVTIDNIFLHCDRVRPSETFKSDLRASIQSGGLALEFKSWSHFRNDITGVSRVQAAINHRSDALDSFVSVMRNAPDENNLLVSNKFLDWNYNALQQYQVRINGVFFPEEPIVASGQAVQAFIEIWRWMGRWNAMGWTGPPTTIDGDDFILDRCLIVVDLNKYPNDASVINPQSTLRHAAHMQLDITLAAAPAVAQNLDTFVLHSIVAILQPNGVFDVQS